MKKTLLMVGLLSTAMMLGGCKNMAGSSSSSSKAPSSSIPSSSSSIPSSSSESKPESSSSSIPSSSSESSSVIPTTALEVETGQSIVIENTGLTFAQGEKEGDVVFLKENQGKTTVYGAEVGITTLTASDGHIYNITCKYKFTNNAISFGYSYARYLDQTGESSTFRKVAKSNYAAGNQNTFYFDVNIKYNAYISAEGKTVRTIALNQIDQNFVGSSVPSFELKNGTLSDIAEIVNDYSLKFKEEAVSDTPYEIAVKFGTTELVQNIVVNNGVNVYDDAGMRQYFEDKEFGGKINVLRCFEAKNEEEDYFYYGDSFETATKAPFNTTYVLKGDLWSSSVYVRSFNDTDTPKAISIIGNYMQIDGSNLDLSPFSKDLEGKKCYYHDGEEMSQGIKNEIVAPDIKAGEAANPQEAIFRITNSTENMYSYLGSEQLVEFNDIEIRGNSNYAVQPGESAGDLSRGKICVKNVNAGITLNNCIFEYAAYGLFTTFANSTTKIYDSILKNTWGAAVASYATKVVELYNTKLANSGSASIWALSAEKVLEIYDAGDSFKIDDKCEIENRIDPGSPWLVAQDLSAAVSSMLSTLEAKVQQMFGYSILKEGKVNFEHGSAPSGDSGFTGSYKTEFTYNDKSSQFCGSVYSTYTDMTVPTFWLGQIFAAGENQIIKVVGMTDLELGTQIQEALVTAGKLNPGGGVYPSANDVLVAYCTVVATNLYSLYTSKGLDGQIVCEFSIPNVSSLAVVLSCQPVTK